MQAGVAKKHNVVDGIGRPAMGGHAGMQQSALHKGEIPCRQPVQLGGKLSYFTGGKKACATKVYAQNGLAVRQTVQPGAQQSAVAADGHDLLGGAVGLLLRQEAHAIQPIGRRKGLRHQDRDAPPGQHSSGLPRNGKPGVLGRVGNQ